MIEVRLNETRPIAISHVLRAFSDGPTNKWTDYPKDGHTTEKCNKADRHKSRAPSLQQRTDRSTDRQTDRPTEWLIESRARNYK